MASFADFTKRQTRDKLFKLIGMQRFEQVVTQIKQRNQRECLQKVSEIVRCKQSQRLRLLEVNSQQEQEKRKQIMKKYQQLLFTFNKLAYKQLGEVVQRIVMRKKGEFIQQLKLNKKQTQGLSAMKNFLQKYDGKVKVQKYLQIWKEKQKEGNAQQQKNQIVQNILGRFQAIRMKGMFRKWKIIYRRQQIEQQILSNLLQYKLVCEQRQKINKDKAFQVWKQRRNGFNKLGKIKIIYERQKVRGGFSMLKLKMLTQRTYNIMKFTQIIQQQVTRTSLKQKALVLQRLYRNKVFPKEAQLIKSQGLIIATLIFKKIQNREKEQVKSFFQDWKELLKQQQRLQLKQGAFLQKCEHLANVVKEIESQRLHQFLVKLNQFYFLRKHQHQLLLKLVLKRNKKLKQVGFQLCQKQLQKIDSQNQKFQSQKLNSVQKIVFLNQRFSLKKMNSFFISWMKECQYQQTHVKVSNAIKTIVATTRIISVFNQYGMVKQAFNEWVTFNNKAQNQQLGSQILFNFNKRKVSSYFLLFKQQMNKLRQQEKNYQMKSKIMIQLLQKIVDKQKAQIFNKLMAQSYQNKFDNEKKKLKQKKTEIHNQIVYLSERDVKLRSLEAQLSMKESRLNEKEKDIKDKQKRIKDHQKAEKERKKSMSKSPSRYAINIPQITQNKIATNNKFQQKPQSSNTQRSQQQEMSKNPIIGKQQQQQNNNQVPPIRMDVISSLQQDFEKVNQRINQVSFPFKSVKEQKNPTVVYSTSSFSSGLSSSQINKENGSNSQSLNEKIQGLKKSSYLSTNNANFCPSSIVSSSGQLSNRSAASGKGSNVINKYENMKIKLLKSAFEKLQEVLMQNQFNSKQQAFYQLRYHLVFDQKVEAAKRMNDYVQRKVLSQCLINWLKSVYEEEILQQESIENRRLIKLYSAIQIVERSKRKEEVLILRYFKEWKRMGFQIILQGLRQYSETININKTRAFPAKKGYFAV